MPVGRRRGRGRFGAGLRRGGKVRKESWVGVGDRISCPSLMIPRREMNGRWEGDASAGKRGGGRRELIMLKGVLVLVNYLLLY